MGVIVQSNEEKSKLQERIAADLRERNQSSAQRRGSVDFVEDSEYSKHMRKTSRFSWFWFILIVLAIISLIVIFVLK